MCSGGAIPAAGRSKLFVQSTPYRKETFILNIMNYRTVLR